jgi:hypothetical protein
MIVKCWHKVDKEFNFVFGADAVVDPYEEAHIIFDDDTLAEFYTVVGEYIEEHGSPTNRAVESDGAVETAEDERQDTDGPVSEEVAD